RRDASSSARRTDSAGSATVVRGGETGRPCDEASMMAPYRQQKRLGSDQVRLWSMTPKILKGIQTVYTKQRR
ncbi:unnamed protein product, partial [Urochloa humidicola]